ncbi:hypothetical protein D3C87_1403720 [compost metagenome]
MPYSAFTSRPSNFFFVTTLITPATASEPYTAPPVAWTVSTRSINAVGIDEKSTWPPAPAPEKIEETLAPTKRRPFTSTSVRLVPRLKRLTKLRPTPKPA